MFSPLVKLMSFFHLLPFIDVLKYLKYFIDVVNKLFTILFSMKLFNGNLEETVLTLLAGTSFLSTTALIQRVRHIRGIVTKQGVYRVLRKLRAEEKVIIYRSRVSLNVLWIETLKHFTERQSHFSILGDLRSLQDGEQLSLRTTSLISLDQLWSDLFSSLEQILPAHHPLFLYNPHNWSILMREETDRIHIERLIKRSRPIFLTIGSATPLDKETVTRVRNSFQCSIRSLALNYYVAVLGDYLIYVKFSRKGTILIDNVFRTITSPHESKLRFLHLNKKISARITIMRNTQKALTWKRRLAKDFYIPKKNRDY